MCVWVNNGLSGMQYTLSFFRPSVLSFVRPLPALRLSARVLVFVSAAEAGASEEVVDGFP